MKRKIVLSLLALFLLMPISSAFAFNDGTSKGMMDSQAMYYNGSSSSPYYVFTDGDVNTGITVAANSYVEYAYPNPASITKLYLYAKNCPDGTFITFLDKNRTVLRTLQIGGSTGCKATGGNGTTVASYRGYTNTTNLTGVYYIRLNVGAGTSISFQEIDTWGTGGIIEPPSTPKGLSGSSDNGSVTLTWSANTENDLKGYNIFRDGVQVNTSVITGTSYVVSSLANGTSYSFRISAVNKSNIESDRSAEVIVVPLNKTPPATPTISKATAGDTTASISWLANKESDLAGYFVYQNGSKLNTNPITATNYVATGLKNDTNYTFQVSAINKSGTDSAKSSPVNVTPFHVLPAAPKNLIARPGDKTVGLTWSANTEADLSGYYVYQDGVKLTSAPIKGTSYDISGLTNKKTYQFEVSAVNTLGEESVRSAAGAIPDDPPPPSAPIGLAATSSNKQIALNWTANTENNIRGYYVYQDGNLITASPVAATTYTINGLQNEKTYTYRVSAINTRSQESAKSQEVQAKPVGTIPQDVTAKAGDAQVLLAWKPVNDASEYRIYRDGVLLKAVNNPPFTDSALTNDTTYGYEISAVVGGVESVKSTVTKARPGKFLDFDNGGGIDAGINSIVQTGFNFLRQYWPYILIVLGVIFAPILVSFPMWLMDKLRPKKTDAGKRTETEGEKRKARTQLSPEESEKRIRERKLNKVRDDKYDHLTRIGRVAERDSWAKQNGYLRPEERKQKANEERNRKAREQRATASESAGRKSRSSRSGRGSRGR